MKVLDIDMDFFLDNIAYSLCDNDSERLSNEEFIPWSPSEVIDYLENKIGLSKDNKIRGKIATTHEEALAYWHELIVKGKLTIPFELIHIDAHADMGLGMVSWEFIMNDLLSLDVKKREEFKRYKDWFSKLRYPSEGDFILFALAFRWISKIYYVVHPKSDGNDYVYQTLKNCDERNPIFKLCYNKHKSAITLSDKFNRKAYYETAIFEPEVPLHIAREFPTSLRGDGYDFLSFSISPQYTPKTADFIVEIIKEYIVED